MPERFGKEHDEVIFAGIEHPWRLRWISKDKIMEGRENLLETEKGNYSYYRYEAQSNYAPLNYSSGEISP